MHCSVTAAGTASWHFFLQYNSEGWQPEEPKFWVSIFWDHLFLFLSLLSLSQHSSRVGLVKFHGDFVEFYNYLTFTFLTLSSKEGERWGFAIYLLVSPIYSFGLSGACYPGRALVLLKQNVLLKAKVHLTHPLASLRNQPKITVLQKGLDTCGKPAAIPSTCHSSKTKFHR